MEVAGLLREMEEVGCSEEGVSWCVFGGELTNKLRAKNVGNRYIDRVGRFTLDTDVVVTGLGKK